MNIRYRVTPTMEEREQQLKRAQILLAADAGSTDEAIARNVAVGTSTVCRTKQQFVEEGLDRALSEAPQPGKPRKLRASDESLLIALACSGPPSGSRAMPLWGSATELPRGWCTPDRRRVRFNRDRASYRGE